LVAKYCTNCGFIRGFIYTFWQIDVVLDLTSVFLL
jgi:hypothetical protein